jgi:hypothetical protein
MRARWIADTGVDPATWHFTPESAEARLNPDLNMWVGRPFIEQDLPDGNAVVPIFGLESTVVKGTAT